LVELNKMLELQLIRHAKTKQSSITGKDFDRELMDKGIAQANFLGRHISVNALDLGTIHCSSAARTQQTASIIRQHYSQKWTIHLNDTLYLAHYMELFSFLTEQESAIITLIGHNEGISDLASYLVDDQIQLKTGEMLRLKIDLDKWEYISKATATITDRYRPEVYLPLALAK
jgi:phosphohistidine phosphatase